MSSEWRKVALMLIAAAMSSSAYGCSTEGLESSKADVRSDDDDDKASDEDDEDGDREADDDESSADAGKRADASSGDDQEDGEDPKGGLDGEPNSDKTPVEGSVDSLWCKAQPIIKKYCADCHVEDAVGPMPLVTVDDFHADAPNTSGKKVYEVTKTRMHASDDPMPPQEVLTPDELKAIDEWIDDGAKPGSDPTCNGATTAAPEEDEEIDWPPPGCEKTYRIVAGSENAKAKIAPNSETHPQFVMDAPWGSEKVQALGFKSVTDNKKVLHHWIVYDNSTRAFINGWAPGKDGSKAKPLPEDVGVYLPSGPRSVRLDVHYYNLNNDQAEEDQSGVEVCTTTKPRKYSATTFMQFAALPIIPPGEHDMVGTCNVNVTQPVFILSESPHAHELATWMKLEVKRGSEVFTLHDKAFNFEEQVATPLEKPFELKTGDVVTTTCRYNNDTPRTVTFGEDTGNEMCFNFVSYYPMGALSCGGAGGRGGLFGG